MKLTDLDKNNVAAKALKESFAVDFDISGLDRPKTLTMLKKVKGLIAETRQSPKQHRSETNPTYMKMLFMEQALSAHLKVAKAPRIVFENEEVDKSQVILAAQDMIDSVQKMYEDVNDMLVKELPALTDSIQSEIGVNESDAFNTAATEALNTINTALQTAQAGLRGALGGLTGQAGAGFDAGAEMPAGDAGGEEVDMDVDMDVEMPAEEPAAEPGVELPPIPNMDDEEDLPIGGAGRAKR
jgi:hypothetical protein